VVQDQEELLIVRERGEKNMKLELLADHQGFHMWRKIFG
jgi:hypothetical protein